MTRDEAVKLAAKLRATGKPEASGIADRLLNAGGDAARRAVRDEVLSEILGPSAGVRRYAVTMSESGRAEICEAASHLEALKTINPILTYAFGEWPEYDDAKVFLAKRGAQFVESYVGVKQHIRTYGSITSPDTPVWDEEAGTIMVLTAPDHLDQDVWVYPILEVELPAESDPLPGWEGGLAQEHFPQYGSWSKKDAGYWLHIGIRTEDDRRRVPDGGFRYYWSVMREGYGAGRDVAQSAKGEDQASAADAQRAAEAALDRHLAAKPMHPIYQYGGVGVDVGVESRRNEKGIFWASNGSTFVLVDNPDRGPFLLGDRRVGLISIHGNGEIRWDVEPGWPGKDGKEAAAYFGLTEVRR